MQPHPQPPAQGPLPGGGEAVRQLEAVRQQEAVRQGALEKRSAGLLQVWKRKHCTLTEEAVLLHAPRHAHGKPKELHFSRVRTVDCVERKGGHAYFTMVMADGREIDFRCRAEERWSAEITLQLVQYKNRQAVLAVRSTRHKQQRLGTGAGESG
ncbi:pleckstrin homology-like domain family A member 1 [Clarias gariepinus]|uniref:pleckstrin homology-like domain family A member 1 n=1 Tax=Clarias gariepinus TaxID=13013 RepID=UPI00234CE3C1|nr:pleckstrin homology-like domain family A member 1 [Clarias gariepinus]